MLSQKYQQYLTQQADDSKISVYHEGAIEDYNTTPLFQRSQNDDKDQNFEFKDTASDMENVLKEFTIRDVPTNKNLEIYEEEEESKIRICDQDFENEEYYEPSHSQNLSDQSPIKNLDESPEREEPQKWREEEPREEPQKFEGKIKINTFVNQARGQEQQD